MSCLRWVAPLVAVAALTACAAPPPKPDPAPPPAPPVGFDGRYRGTARLIRSDNRYCPRSGPRVHEVQNGVVTLSYQGAGRARIPITAPIRANIRHNRLQQALALGYLFFWALTGLAPVDRRDWLLENFLVVLFTGLLIATYRRFPFSDLSYSLIALFLAANVVIVDLKKTG